MIFSTVQAIACADANVTLISPFVGRILDWYKSKFVDQDYTADNDPGVMSVREIFNYYKHFGYKTEIMGASFRNIGQVLALAGCDLLTVSPTLLSQLDEMEDINVEKCLSLEQTKGLPIEKISYDEKSFRYALNNSAVATEKLAEGIRNFSTDIEKLEKLLEA